jgi:hypothetical protein
MITFSGIPASSSSRHRADLTNMIFFNSTDQPKPCFREDFQDQTMNLKHYAICSEFSETHGIAPTRREEKAHEMRMNWSNPSDSSYKLNHPGVES